MTTRISSNNLDTSVTAQFGPKISGIVVTNDSYTNLDDTAVDIAGGYIKIIGTGFATGCQVLINTTPATSVTYISSTEVRAQLPATAAGTYVVYLVNTDGGVAIRFNGVTFSGTPTWSTGSTLSGSETDSAISIQLAATGDTPMTYALQAGSSLPVGLSLNSSGLLSGAVTGLNNDTTYNFTVVATDAQLQDSPRAFSITISSGDSSWSYVTTLLNADVTPFNADASSNAFAVTLNGDTRPNNFSPYTSGYYSNYFDGSGDNTAVATNAVFNLGSNDFSFEAWIYPVSITNTSAVIASQWGLNGDEGIWQLALTGNNFIWQYDVDGAVPQSTTTISTTGGITFNQWQHVLVTRIASGGNSITRLFIDGVLKAYNSVSTYSITTSASPIRLGMQGFTTYRNGEPYHGYISNFRFVNGSVPTGYATAATTVDTAVFAPSTVPLTTTSQGATAAQVELLLAQSNRFIDNSTNNFTVTRNGDTLISGFDPFTPATNYSTYGSTYFDGTGDYLSVPSNSAFAFGTGDYTIEAWVYITVSAAQAIVGNGDGAVANPYFYINGTTPTLFFNNTAVASGPAIPLNAWTHVAVTRSGTLVQVFTNGVAGTGATNAISMISSGLTIGASSVPSQFITGYISNLRIVKGTAVYTSAFTPSTQPLTAIANTSLLTLQNNTPANNSVFIDNSTNNFLITRNGNTTQGTFSPYGAGWSNYFDGTGDYLTAPNTVSNFGTGDFTIECWVYRTSTNKIIISNVPSGTDNNYFYLNVENTEATCSIRDNTSQVFAYGPASTTNTWNHIALTRSSGSVRVFVNGVSGTPVTITKTITSRLTVIGAFLYTGFEGYSLGYISNLRIIKGQALYTSNFTPSTIPLQPVAGTSLLACADPRFIDDSANNFAITRVGDVSVQRFSPFAGTTLPAPAYSAYFDGTGDYLSIADSVALQMSTDNFTLEAWVYPMSTDQLSIFSKGQSGSSGFTFYINNGSLIFLHGSSTTITSSSTVPLSSWSHVAAVREGTGTNQFKLYINGTSVATATVSTNFNQTNGLSVSYGRSGSATGEFNGYISNARIVKGTALYTANFTPPTAPLTAISGTSLLTCQSATFTDNSTNAFSITAFGNSQPSLFSPFTVTYSTKQLYSPAVIGGSMSFDGTGDYLSLASSSAFNMGAANFTVEAWYYFTALPGSGTNDNLYIFGNYNPYLYLWGDGTIILRSAQTSGDIINVAHGFTVNQWYHIAVVKTGTSFVLYRNGSVLGSGTSSAIVSENKSLEIGGQTTFGFTGYMSDFRTVNGTAVYTSNFVPPTTPVTAVRNTTLLLNGTSAGVLDSSAIVDFETASGVQISTNIKKFGTGSMLFSGSNFVSSASNPAFAFGTGDYTIEAWVYPTTIRNGENLVYATDVTGGTSFGFNQTQIYVGARATGFDLQVSYTMQANTWTHIAVARQSGTARIFANGTLVGSGTISRSCPQGPAGVGDYPTLTGNGVTGYIDDLRITRGVARYITTFTPPSGAIRGK